MLKAKHERRGKDTSCEFCDTVRHSRKSVTVTAIAAAVVLFEEYRVVCFKCGHRYFDADVREAWNAK